jgi:CRISPR-associated endonuclease Cas1
MQDLLNQTYTLDDRNGIAVVDGYGVRIGVERGHLLVTDGSGRHRRQRRYPKVGHGLQRLVILGHTGGITLDALRWCDRVGIAVSQLDPNGELVTTTARAGLDDARLRRAQALAASMPLGHRLAVDLIDGKLAGQADVANQELQSAAVADRIERLRNQLHDTTTVDQVRDLEAKAASVYFKAWSNRVAVTWASKDMPRIPAHWLGFKSRRTPLRMSSGARRAADPINALLNYLYALAEIECRLACLTVGLDPGLGVIHADVRARDSLALDLIEPVRPVVDRYVIDLLDGHAFRRADFHEADDGHIRILPPLTHHLAGTLATWRSVVAPWAEHLAHAFADASPYNVRKATSLTSATRRRVAQDPAAPRRKNAAQRSLSTPRSEVGPPAVCVDCGNPVTRQRRYCAACWPNRRTEALDNATHAAAAQVTDEHSRARRGEAVARGKNAARQAQLHALGFQPDDWRSIRDGLAHVSLRQITDATGLSIGQASRLKTGKSTAHPRHWPTLALLTK